LITAGFGITITGIGTAADPFVIVNSGANLASALVVGDTATINMTRTGAGTNVDPIIISGDVIMKLQQLQDVSNPAGAPVAGQRPVYVGTSGTDGHWEFQTNWPQYTTAGRPAVGTAPAGFVYFDTTLGKPVWRKSNTQYVDATGAVV